MPVEAGSFMGSLPVFRDFGRVADAAAYAALPDDWVLGLSDVVRSGEAIAAGRYKAVNMAGAAVIAAVSNTLGLEPFPFVFGGDGASFAVPPAHARAARQALAATATLAEEELDLELRVAEVPVAAIRLAGFDVTVALFAASEDVTYAMFAGGGLAWAEERMKAGDFAIPKAAPGTRPDLLGLSCRFDETPAQRGLILSMIVRPAEGASPTAFAELVAEILRLVEGSPEMARPVPESGPALGWPNPGTELEARAGRRPGQNLWARRAGLFAWSAFAAAIMKFRIRIGGFDPARYIGEVVANTDYRKYDDGLRMTIDCSPELADVIERRLARAEADGVARVGLHRQGATLMTCITPSLQRRDHIHFLDGAGGGYAAAAAAFKR